MRKKNNWEVKNFTCYKKKPNTIRRQSVILNHYKDSELCCFRRVLVINIFVTRIVH